jgi:hypothetical protein
MQPQNDSEYKALLSDVIKKQIVILGPDITLVKARNVKGLVVADDGTVTEITGAPQEITQNLIDQFVQLSGMIVKKTMEPLLAYHPTVDGFSPQSVAAAAMATPVATIIPPIASTEEQPVQQADPIQNVQNVITPIPTVPPPAMPIEQPQQVSPAPIVQPTEQVDTKTQQLIDDALKQVQQ